MNVVIMSGIIVSDPKFTINEEEEMLCNFYLRTVHNENKINYVWCSVRGSLAQETMKLMKFNYVQIRGHINSKYNDRYYFYTVDIDEITLLIDKKTQEIITKEEQEIINKTLSNQVYYVKNPETKDTLEDISHLLENI